MDSGTATAADRVRHGKDRLSAFLRAFSHVMLARWRPRQTGVTMRLKTMRECGVLVNRFTRKAVAVPKSTRAHRPTRAAARNHQK